MLGLRRCAGFSPAMVSRGPLSVAVLRLLTVARPHCCRAQALGRVGFSSRGSEALEPRLSSCGALFSWLLSLWDLPGSGMELVSPALAGRLFTTEPAGKPSFGLFLN